MNENQTQTHKQGETHQASKEQQLPSLSWVWEETLSQLLHREHFEKMYTFHFGVLEIGFHLKQIVLRHLLNTRFKLLDFASNQILYFRDRFKLFHRGTRLWPRWTSPRLENHTRDRSSQSTTAKQRQKRIHICQEQRIRGKRERSTALAKKTIAKQRQTCLGASVGGRGAQIVGERQLTGGVFAVSHE